VSTAGKWTFPMVFAQDTSPYSQDIPKTTVPEWIACLLPHLLGKVLPWKASRISGLLTRKPKPGGNTASPIRTAQFQLRLSAFGHIPSRSASPPSPHLPLRRSPCLPLYRHRASLSALTRHLPLCRHPPRSPPRRLRVGRMTTKSLRWPSAVIGCGNGGRMRTQSPSLQWRVASDTEYGVR
jgi:hypothetical protein